MALTLKNQNSSIEMQTQNKDMKETEKLARQSTIMLSLAALLIGTVYTAINYSD